MPFHYRSRTQLNRSYSSESRRGNITQRHKNHCNETSILSIYDILRPGTPREGFKTFSPRTKTIYDMYRSREPRVVKEDFIQKNTFGSASLCIDSQQRTASPAAGRFTVRSLHFPATQNKSSFTPASRKQSPKRTPLSSIIWNRSDYSRERQKQEEFLGAPSPMDIDPADQYMYSQCFQERKYKLYHSQNAYQGTRLNIPMDNAMSCDTLENSENMPFYHQDNPFASSFFNNPFRRNREQRFGHSSFWHQQEECSWSDFPQSRKPFTSSDRDFGMISIEANSEASVQGPGVPSQYWGPFSPCYGTNVFRGQGDPHHWWSDFQTSPPERMDMSHVNENQSPPHFGTPDVFPMTAPSCHSHSAGLESPQGRSPVEVAMNEGPHLFANAQPLLSSFRASFPQIPDDRGNSQGLNFQNATVSLQETFPNKPDSLPVRSCTEVTTVNNSSTESLSHTEAQLNFQVTEMNNEKDMSDFISEDKQLNKMDQKNKTGGIPQPVFQTEISNSLPKFQNPHSQNTAQNDRSGFNAPVTVSSKRSPRVFSRKDTSQIYITQRDKTSELNKGQCFPGNRKLDSETSLPFLQESRTLTSFPSPNQACYQESTVHNEDRLNIIKNKHWCSEPTNQGTQSPQREECPATKSTNCSRLGTGDRISQESLGLSSDVPHSSSSSNSSFLDALLVLSTTAFPRSPSDKELSLKQREEKDNANENQNNHFSVNSSENQESKDSSVPPGEVADGAQCHPYSPFRSGRGTGRVRRHVSCIEKLSKMENRLAPTNEGSSSTEDQSSSRASECGSVYCTLPRKSASFLTSNKQSESKITAAPIRNGPLPFQAQSKVDAPIHKCTSNKPSPSSPQSVSECSQIASDLVLGQPEATKKMTSVKAIRSASVRKGPLPFLIKRAMSCPSGEPYISSERDEREKSSALDTDASAVMPKSWEKIFNPVKSDSSLTEFTLAKRRHQKEFSQECIRKDAETTAPSISSFTPLKEDPVPFCADVSGKETKKALHKLKTTSMFSVSGDEENIKCLEVVSIYYTLPRKPSKKFCSLLQQFSQDTDSLRKPFGVEMETCLNALERDELYCPAQEQSTIPSPGDLKTQVDSAPDCLSHTTENVTVSQLPSSGPSKSTLEEMASVGPDASLRKGKPKTREIVPDNLAKTPLGDSQIRKKSGGELSSPSLQTSLMLQEKCVRKEKPRNSLRSANRVSSASSGLPAHSESNVEKCQTKTNCEACASGASTARGKCPWRDHTAVVVDDSSSGSQPREANGATGSNCQNLTEKMLSDSESEASALTPVLHKLQLAEEAGLGEADLPNLPSEPRELLQRSQEINTTEIRKVENETQKLIWDQTLVLDGNNKNKTDLDDLEKREDRYSIHHRVAAMSKANRKFPAKDLSPRRHVATIFPQSESKRGFGRLSVCRLECNPLSPELIPKSTGSTDESSLVSHRMSVDKSKKLLQVSAIPSREPSGHPCHQEADNFSQLHQDEFHSVSESPPENEDYKNRTVAQISEAESGTPAQLTLSTPREQSSDRQWRLSPPLSQEPAQNSTTNLSLTHQQLQHRSVSSPEWEHEPHLYRSKSLKNINVHGDLPRTNHPSKVRGRHFSESTSLDNALSQLSLGDDFPDNSGYSRRFKSFSELPSSDESESWTLPSNRTRTGPKSTSSISRPIDYGIFGKEQQLAFLENVKRSLTQGRLWKPSFLKNPGFLKDNVLNSSNPSQSELFNSPSCQVPESSPFPSEPLNIYEEDLVESDWDTDTTTDDEYYLDENDKESEL
uniref:Exophilin 5 n=2 Tax=Nannospalax galili TaxID=1026970 RepID=A0A8C6RAZ1_NANGA